MTESGALPNPMARAIRTHSIVRMANGCVGYLEKNTGMHNYWVVVEPGALAIEIKPTTRLEVVHTPLTLAMEWIKQKDHDPGKQRTADDHDRKP